MPVLGVEGLLYDFDSSLDTFSPDSCREYRVGERVSAVHRGGVVPLAGCCDKDSHGSSPRRMSAAVHRTVIMSPRSIPGHRVCTSSIIGILANLPARLSRTASLTAFIVGAPASVGARSSSSASSRG